MDNFPELDCLRDFVRSVTEWTAKYPLKGKASAEDKDAALIIYYCCEGAEDNLFDLRQKLEALREAGAVGAACVVESAPDPMPTCTICGAPMGYVCKKCGSVPEAVESPATASRRVPEAEKEK